MWKRSKDYVCIYIYIYKALWQINLNKSAFFFPALQLCVPWPSYSSWLSHCSLTSHVSANVDARSSVKRTAHFGRHKICSIFATGEREIARYGSVPCENDQLLALMIVLVLRIESALYTQELRSLTSLVNPFGVRIEHSLTPTWPHVPSL